MTRFVWVLLGVFLGMGSASAQVAQDQATCRQFGTRALLVEFRSLNPKQRVFCDFGGGVGIEARTLRAGNRNIRSTQATLAYAQNTATSRKDCFEARAWEEWGNEIPGGFSYFACRFNDGSMIESRTFREGPNSTFNRALNRALRLQN